MKRNITYIMLLFFLAGCSHNEFRSYLLNEKPENQRKAYQRRLAANDINYALLVRDHFDGNEKKMSSSSHDPFDGNVKKMSSSSHDHGPLETVTDVVLHTENDAVLNTARKDLETFFITARSLKNNKMDLDLEILNEVARDYLDKRIDPLLDARKKSHSPYIQKALTELKYIKANLLYELNDMESACDTVTDLERTDHHEETAKLGVAGEKLEIDENPYIVMTDFSYMCNQK